MNSAVPRAVNLAVFEGQIERELIVMDLPLLAACFVYIHFWRSATTTQPKNDIFACALHSPSIL